MNGKKKGKNNIKLEKAEILFKYKLIQKIDSQALKSRNYKAAMWMLSHKYPEEWGPRSTEQKKFDDRLYSRSKFNKKNYKQILADSETDWRAAAYILIDRFPKEFIRK